MRDAMRVAMRGEIHYNTIGIQYYGYETAKQGMSHSLRPTERLRHMNDKTKPIGQYLVGYMKQPARYCPIVLDLLRDYV